MKKQVSEKTSRKITIKKTVLHDLIWGKLKSYKMKFDRAEIIFEATNKHDTEINIFIEDILENNEGSLGDLLTKIKGA